MHARIEIIMGSMYSGKSTELIRRCSTFESINKNVLMINHSFDSRCDHNEIQTHSKTKHKAIKTERLMDLEILVCPDVIGIDEAQFFGDLYEFVKKYEKEKTVVIIAGLDGDFLRRPFGEILKCIPIADNVTKLNSMCKLCGDGTSASFTMKTTNDDSTNVNVIEIGAEETYSSVCRYHYFNPSNDTRNCDK